MHRLVALDVDGTLLPPGGWISARNVNTLQKLAGLGVHVVLATGRPPAAISTLLAALDLHGPQIASGGAIVFESPGGSIVHKTAIPATLVTTTVELGRQFGLTVVLARDHQIFVESVSTADIDYMVNYGYPEPQVVQDLFAAVEPQPIEIVMVARGREERLTSVKNVARRLFEGKLQCSHTVPGFLDFIREGVSKGQALRIVLERLRLIPQDVVAIGDSESDVSLFQAAGFSVAMGNAELRVKGVADSVTETCDRDGVSVALESLILSGGA